MRRKVLFQGLQNTQDGRFWRKSLDRWGLGHAIGVFYRGYGRLDLMIRGQSGADQTLYTRQVDCVLEIGALFPAFPSNRCDENDSDQRHFRRFTWSRYRPTVNEGFFFLKYPIRSLMNVIVLTEREPIVSFDERQSQGRAELIKMVQCPLDKQSPPILRHYFPWNTCEGTRVRLVTDCRDHGKDQAQGN